MSGDDEIRAALEASRGSEGATADDKSAAPAPEASAGGKPRRAARSKQGAADYRISTDGKWIEHRRSVEDAATGKRRAEWVPIASRIDIAAMVRDHENGGWGQLLLIPDRDGNEHLWAMPAELLASDGQELRRGLLSRGAILRPGQAARLALLNYFVLTEPEARARCVDRIGWHGRRFVLPDETITSEDDDAERVILQTGAPLDHAFRQAGTLEGWQETVAAPAIGNSRLLLALSAAFAAPLLAVAGVEGGGFNLRGASSSGKSTALRVAGSVWGGGGLHGYTRTWRATANAAEAMAAAHCDVLLPLDELGQVDGREAGAFAYMLAQGQGKQRAGRDGSVRRPTIWRALFLSTGEVSLGDKIEEGGGRVAAGMAVRVVDVRADAGAGFGLFEDLHGADRAATFAASLSRGASDNYGHAGRELVREVVKDPEGVGSVLRKAIAAFVQEAVPPGADGQVRRVADRFGLVAAAGELARAIGIVPWAEGAAREAARRCFADWIADRGGAGSGEVADAIRRLRAFLEAHGAGRFEPWHRDPRRAVVLNRAGFVRSEIDVDGEMRGPREFFILPTVWKAEILGGLDLKMINAELVRLGILVPGNDGKAVSVHKPPVQGGALRLYAIHAQFLEGEHGAGA